MRTKDEDLKLTKIHKNVQGMLSEAKKIIRSSSLLPAINQPSHSNYQTLVPSQRINNHLKSLFQNTDHSYSKDDKRGRKSEHLTNSEPDHSVDFKHRFSEEKSVPIFFNKNTGRYELSTLLGRYQSDLIDNPTTARLARSSNRQLYNKKMINLLPQIPQKPKRRLLKDLQKKENEQPSSRYHATISIHQDLRRQKPVEQEQKVAKTIEVDTEISFVKEKQILKNRKQTKKKKERIRPRVRINQTSLLQKLEGTKPHRTGQHIEDYKCEPWKYDLQQSEDLFN